MSLPIVVFSHLRWNFVHQRPQHVLARLAENHRILFVEEPITAENGDEDWETHSPHANVTVAKARLRDIVAPAFGDEQIAKLKALMPDLLEAEGIDRCILWFYSPMAAPIAAVMPADLVAYDCMDELSAFLHAPPQLLERERKLLGAADVVFTGGPSLYRAKKHRHHDVHCFPSSVDVSHFGQARGLAEEAVDQADLPHPRLGFFGVIDERMDLKLIEGLADAHPDWQIVMVGPVVKIDSATLPQRENIHWLGQRSYAELPGYLQGWDVCLLPFARNEATRFISPTKTLEYMAAEKPIVSTPITDVAEPFSHIVRLGSTVSEFVQACADALEESAAESSARVNAMREVLARTSWQSTVHAMREILLDRLQRNSVKRTKRGLASRIVETQHTGAVRVETGDIDAPLSPAPVVVIGAGPTGLSAAYHLGPDTILLERNSQVGGWCRSIEDRGFTFDMAGHIMFSNDSYVHDLYRVLLGDNVHWQDREAFIYSKGVHTRYPFQGCLYGLPPEVITECIVGAIEARFGAIKPVATLHDSVSQAAGKSNGAISPQSNGHAAAHTNGHAPSHANGHAPSAAKDGSNGTCAAGTTRPLTDCCGDGIAESEVPLSKSLMTNGHAKVQGNGAAHLGTTATPAAKPRNFEEFIHQVWGRGIAKHFAIPYNKKLWAVPLEEMETSWLGGRVPMPDLEEMIKYALTPASKPMGPNARFGYPLRGGFQALMNGFLPFLNGKLRLNTAITAVSPRAHTVTLDDGSVINYDQLISTMPLPLLIQSMGDEVPEAIRDAAAQLRHVSVRCVNIGVGRPNITEKHWVYYPEDTVFHRIFFQGNASPHCNPAGGFGLTCEITYSASKPLPCDGEELIQRCIEDCRRVGVFAADDQIVTAHQVDLPHAYVVYDHARPKLVAAIREWLHQHDIILAGRYSEWEYFNSDHAFLAGRRAAEEANARLQLKNRDRSENMTVPA